MLELSWCECFHAIKMSVVLVYSIRAHFTRDTQMKKSFFDCSFILDHNNSLCNKHIRKALRQLTDLCTKLLRYLNQSFFPLNRMAIPWDRRRNSTNSVGCTYSTFVAREIDSPRNWAVNLSNNLFPILLARYRLKQKQIGFILDWSQEVLMKHRQM